MAELIHGELSYKLIGLLYKVYNIMGSGLQEKYYQKAIAQVLRKEGIPFLEQVRTDIELGGTILGRYFLDFIIDHKLVLEIKARSYFSKRDIHQVLGYLKKSGLELGILAGFGSEGIKFKRILRGNSR